MTEVGTLKADKHKVFEFKRCVIAKYGLNSYGKMREETNKMIESYIAIIKRDITPENAKRYNIT